MKRLITILALACILFSSCSKPHDERRQIYLVHNLYHSDESFISLERALLKEFPDTNKYRIDYISLTEVLYKWENEDFSDLLRAKYDKGLSLGLKNPDMIILYGDQIAHAAARIKDHPWVHGTHFIFAGVADPNYEGLLESRKDFTGMWYTPGIRQTLDMMRDLGCSRWVTTTLDSTYQDSYYRKLMVEQLGDSPQKYDLNFDLSKPAPDQQIAPADTGATLLIPLHMRGNRDNGRFNYTDWLRSFNHKTTFLRLKDDRPGVDVLSHPLRNYYALTPERFNMNYHGSLNACIGGYMVPFPQIAHDIRMMTDEIFDQGKKPEQIAWREHKADYWMDWKIAHKEHSYADELPKYIKFANLPWRQKSKLHDLLYSYGLLAALIISWLILLSTIIILSIKTNNRKQRLIQDGEAAQRSITQMSDTIASTGCYIFRIDKDGLVKFNPDFYIDTGITNRPHPYTYFTRMMASSSRMRFEHAYQRNDEGRKITRLKFSIASPINGQKHYMDMRMCNNVHPDGTKTVSGLLFSMDNVQKMVEERREAMRKEEEATIKRAFLTSMGHEIRTPLNAIVGYSRLIFDMYDELSEEERTMYADVITKNTEQLLSLLNEVISYSGDESHEPAIVLSAKKVSDLMEEMYLTYRIIVPQNLEFRFERGCEDDYVMVNRGSMLQIVSNLMNNAVKFTKEGVITLGWKSTADKISIYVRDTGCGIDKKNLDVIFDRYFKESASSEGAGIGLALCSKLVKKMNGKITVSSKLGEGSCFEIILDRAVIG